jgi:hypothetical protein
LRIFVFITSVTIFTVLIVGPIASPGLHISKVGAILLEIIQLRLHVRVLLILEQAQVAVIVIGGPLVGNPIGRRLALLLFVLPLIFFGLRVVGECLLRVSFLPDN